MKTILPSRLLKLALTADMVVTGAVAALQLAAADALSQLLLLPRPLLVDSGIFLVAYTVLLAVLVRSSRIWAAIVAVIVIGNVGWALGCVALLASGAVAPSMIGVAFVIVQAVAVSAFAVLELKGLLASAPALDGTEVRA